MTTAIATKTARKDSEKPNEIYDNTMRLPFGDPPTGADAADAAPDAWRSVTLDALGIVGKAAEALKNAKLTTLGKIADWTAKDNKFTDIKGCGPATAEQIEKRIEEYWKQNPRSESGAPRTGPRLTRPCPVDPRRNGGAWLLVRRSEPCVY